MAKKETKKTAAKRKKAGPLAGRHVVVVAPSVIVGNIVGKAIMESQELAEKPVAMAGLPRGLANYEKVAVVATTGQSLPAGWQEQMSRRLDDVEFFTEEELR